MLRNREIRWLCCGCLAVTVLGAVIGFLINWTTGVLVLVLAVCFGTLFFLFTKYRYEKIAELSEQIDLVLHYGERMDISEEEEGSCPFCSLRSQR